jgi:GNAT superfamily N-acetyltransferase
MLPMTTANELSVVVRPATVTLWPDVERLFGPRGACGGCWCMHWRLPPAEYDRLKGDGNRAAFREIVQHGPAPGLIGYVADDPIAWCAVGPCQSFPRLGRRVTDPENPDSIWSITCLFVARSWRRRGISVEMVRAGAEFARENGAAVIEAYPIVPKLPTVPDAFAWTGLVSTFVSAGFVEHVRRSPTQMVMRRRLV